MSLYVNEHSERRSQIAGLRLVWGSTILPTDVYDSRDGNWREAREVFGDTPMKLRFGCRTVWVRPQAKLSKESIALLSELVRKDGRHFYLAGDDSGWKVVPSPAWASDGRMDWRVLHPECVEDLIKFGYVSEFENGRPLFDRHWSIYWPTELAVELIESLQRPN